MVVGWAAPGQTLAPLQLTGAMLALGATLAGSGVVRYRYGLWRLPFRMPHHDPA
jgi:hypothetical protein